MIDNKGQAPYADDDTRRWVETYRVDGKIKPNVLLRIGTDTNYMLNQSISLPPYAGKTETKGIMNLAMPGMRLPHVLNWSVSESSDNPVSTASFELINALQVSDIEATLTSTIPKQIHDYNVMSTYVMNSLGVIEQIDGNVDVQTVTDQNGIPFRKDQVKYRTFNVQTFTVDNASAFPDPACPDDVEGADIKDHPAYTTYVTGTGVGNYFVLIDNEVIRVSAKVGNTFYIIAGGRQQSNYLEQHLPNAKVKLLGFGPRSGEWCGYGYLAMDDFKPYKNLLRPGTCIVSYEGYGKLPTNLSHSVDSNRNYVFTGYWFVKGLEASVGEDGVPKLRVDLASAGDLLNAQKITQDILNRCKTQFGQWRIGQKNQTIWGAAGHDRNIPGDWEDFNAWDPMLKDSYPLAIKTSYAQNKEFLQHMTDTQMGQQCAICRQELKEWLSEHPGQDPVELDAEYEVMPAGPARDALGQKIESLKLLQTRAIGRHIYKQSIRVMTTTAGPILTYIRLMGTMAAAAWDHPAYGTELAQMFTKIPNDLYDNIRDIKSGLVYNGQVDFTRQGFGESDIDWAKAYDDEGIISKRSPLTCPFEATYDKAPFFQPMQDLADVNGNTFWINREGKPVFMPRSMPLRPYGSLSPQKYEWFLSTGGSISAYSHSINTDSIVTQVWVTGTTAFDSTFTVPAAGTGFNGSGGRMIYSPLSGNKEGLALTSGVQQVDTVSLDNVSLGLDWNTDPATWGIDQTRDGADEVITALPAMYDGYPPVSYGSKNKKAIIRIQNIINFFLVRRYLPAIVYGGDSTDPSHAAHYTLTPDGIYGHLMENAVVQLQDYLINTMPTAERPTPLTDIQAERDAKNYGRATYKWIVAWLHSDTLTITTTDGRTVSIKSNNYVRTDIWWYAQNGMVWEEYVGAVVGLKIPLKPSGIKKQKAHSQQALETPLYVVDDKGMQEAVSTWSMSFTQSMVNMGNRVVDDSINKASLRSISTNLADPRIQPGDILWCEVPGHLTQYNIFGKLRPPFTNGVYVTSISRQLDLQAGTYTGSYSGYRYRGDFGSDDQGASIGSGYDFIGEIDS